MRVILEAVCGLEGGLVDGILKFVSIIHPVIHSSDLLFVLCGHFIPFQPVISFEDREVASTFFINCDLSETSFNLAVKLCNLAFKLSSLRSKGVILLFDELAMATVMAMEGNTVGTAELFS